MFIQFICYSHNKRSPVRSSSFCGDAPQKSAPRERRGGGRKEGTSSPCEDFFWCRQKDLWTCPEEHDTFQHQVSPSETARGERAATGPRVDCPRHCCQVRMSSQNSHNNHMTHLEHCVQSGRFCHCTGSYQGIDLIFNIRGSQIFQT